MAHDRNKHYATCSWCGWIGKESELPGDPDHECGKDECPSCKQENFISCCLDSYEAAENHEPE